MKVKIECPYCKFENKKDLKARFYYPKEVITCDDYEGGCGKSFVIEGRVTVSIERFKIEEIGGKENE